MASTEVLNLEVPENQRSWSDSQDLPHGIANFNAMVGSREGMYLGYSVGGIRAPVNENTIYGLRKNSTGGLQWDVVSKMHFPRYYHSVVNAPLYLVPSC